MFKLRCLVFPFHWLKGQAGLCLAPSHLPSHFPGNGGVVQCAAYLRSHLEAWRWRWALYLSLPTDSSLSDNPPFCLMFIHKSLWKIQPEFLETCGFLCILSPVLFSRWSSVGPTRGPFSTDFWAVYRSASSVLRFWRKIKSQWKEPMCFAFLERGRLKSRAIIVAWSLLSSFKKKNKIQLCWLWQADDVLASEHRAPLYFSSIVGHVA